MTNQYKVLKDKHQKAVNEFPLMFAFNQQQFDEGMKKLGLEPTDTDKIYSLGGGGYYRKTDSKAFHEMLDKNDKEFKQAIEEDTTGEGFILDMFTYELANHEYGYTMEVDQTLEALGFSFDDINSNEKLKHGLELAKKKFK